MKNQFGNIKNIIVLCMALLLGPVVNAQVGSDNGIHVSGGSSSQSKVSSNIGNSTTATGYNSFASGYGSEASGHTSTALGREARALGNYSGAFGNFVKASGENSFVLGKGFTSALPLTNSAAGIMMGVNSQQPTLTISAASSANYTGKIGIGNVTSPSAKLHIKADSSGEGEDADIMLEPTASGKYAAIYFKTKDNYIRLRNVAGLDFNAPRYNFLTGKVGIGIVSDPQATLHIKANSGENANIMLQTTDNTKDAAIIFRNTSNTISVGSNNLMNFAATSYSFTTGKVGIGTKTPSCKLEVAGSAKTTSLQTGTLNVTGDVSFGNLAGNTTKIVTVGTDGKLNAKSGLFIADNGNVRIGSGTGNPSKALEVNGTIRSKEVIVEVANWSDFVFDNNYNLMSLKETERFIKQNGHLPNVPSAAEVEKDGVQLGEMNAILLQKVEELMLYVIELEKKIDSLEKEYTRKE